MNLLSNSLIYLNKKQDLRIGSAIDKRRMFFV